ncbi:MAG: aspartate-semialdehyde dehydrogenase [Papillibacter sp.]|nr:aspartate-semialdehyde dehydrogenase [Papillibacter sp.]
MNINPRIAIVGATGMVGRTFLKVLEERQLRARDYVLFASGKSAGTELDFMYKKYVVQELREDSFDSGFDIALFSAGGGVSLKFAPLAASRGCVVIDNSSAWRMDPSVPLVVPEVNSEAIRQHRGIIANPNCNVIPATVALKPLYDAYGIRRVVYSTYQAVSGAGRGGWDDLENGLRGQPPKKFPHPIANNCLPHIDVFTDSGYTKEEIKTIDETRKILGCPSLRVTTTNVRVPVFNCHSISLNVELERPFELSELKARLAAFPGLVLTDDVKNNVYPMPINVSGHDEVYVGRVRRDESVDSGVNLWVVGDNVRKGAATNAVQIAQKLLEWWKG